MPRTLVHVFIAIVWALVIPSVSLHYLESAPSTPDVMVWMGRLLGVFAINILGFFALLWSWLTQDAVAHGKPRSTALAFALASIPSCGLAMVAYFYATRERKEAAIATVLYFAICFVLLTATSV
jgi:hypothetical protein